MNPKILFSNWRREILAVLLFFPVCSSVAANLQLASVLGPSINASTGANGDSGLPIVSADGRYVLFASTANNLVLFNNNSPISYLNQHAFNVFLRDRINGTTTLVSVNLSGTGGNGDSLPCGISTNGQYALFESTAGDLVAGDTNNSGDVFVRDLVNGTTTLVSVSTNGVSGSGMSRSPNMTPDGRYVAFVSDAPDLVANDTNGIPDVFVRDLQTGTTTLASVGQQSVSPITLITSSESPEITPDGRYVVFFSAGSNAVSPLPFPLLAGEVYVHDLIAGTTIWASTNTRSIFSQLVIAKSQATNAISFNPIISADGQFVAFEAATTNVFNPSARGVVLRYNLQTQVTDIIHTNANVPFISSLADIKNLDMTPDGRFVAFAANITGAKTNTTIYRWDAQTGTNTLVSADLTSGLPATGIYAAPDISSNGQYVAFLCNATNLTANALAGGYDLYVRDMQAGTTKLIDADTNGVGAGVDQAIAPALSEDGSTLAFERIDGNLVPDDRNHDWDLFARDLATDTTELISVHDPALPSQSPNGFSTLFSSSVSTNGRYIAFASDADNLVANDTNGYRDVFVSDLLLGTNVLVSVALNGFTSPGISSEPAINGDGRFVAFSSYATNLVAGDTNSIRDVFLRDLHAGTTALVSVSTNGGFGDFDSYSPTISGDGRFVLFRSKANNLAAGSFGNGAVENLFLRDQQSALTYALTAAASGSKIPSASMTPDGHFIAFVGAIIGSTSNLYVWDSQAANLIYTNTSGSFTNISISSDGRWLAYVSGPALNVFDLVGGTNYLIANASFNSRAGLQFSADGRFLTFATKSKLVASDTNGTYDVYLYDFQTGTNLLVSQSFNSTNAANDASDSPVISADGRFVAYRSAASNIVANDFNNAPDIFLYDRLSGATALVTVDQVGDFTGDNRSLTPVFSADGQTLVFQSWASDLLAGDFNSDSDLFAFDMTAFPVTGSNGSGTTNPVFYAQLIPPGGSAQFPALSWPLASGKSYKAQFKDDLNDPDWQDVNGKIIFIGATGYISDLSPSPNQRFYRIISNN